MKPTQVLEHEHEIILKVLQAAECEIKIIDDSGTLRAERIEQFVDFIRNFADRCHHAKEEKKLFALMEQRGMSSSFGPVAVMLHDHEESRAYVRAMVTGLEKFRNDDASGVQLVRDNLASYINLLRMHIHKENNILYPMAVRMMTAEDEEKLLEEFDKIEREEMGEGVHEKYHRLAHELTEQ